MFINKIGTQIININMNSKFFLASVAIITAGYTTSTYLLKERDIQLKDRECQMKERIAQLKYSSINTTNNNK